MTIYFVALYSQSHEIIGIANVRKSPWSGGGPAKIVGLYPFGGPEADLSATNFLASPKSGFHLHVITLLLFAEIGILSTQTFARGVKKLR